MKIRVSKALLLALIGVLLLSGVALAASQQTIDWWVVGAGGGRAQGGVYTLDGTIGQAVTGENNASSYDLCAGYWCGVKAVATYLPWISAN